MKRRAIENDPSTTGIDQNCPRQTETYCGISVGTIDMISNNFSKKLGNVGQKFASGKCLGWRQIHEIVRTVERLMPGFLEVISDFI